MAASSLLLGRSFKWWAVDQEGATGIPRIWVPESSYRSVVAKFFRIRWAELSPIKGNRSLSLLHFSC